MNNGRFCLVTDTSGHEVIHFNGTEFTIDVFELDYEPFKENEGRLTFYGITLEEKFLAFEASSNFDMADYITDALKWYAGEYYPGMELTLKDPWPLVN